MSNLRLSIIAATIGFILLVVLAGTILIRRTNPVVTVTPTPISVRVSATPFFIVTPTPAFENGPTPTVDPPINGTGGDGDSGLSKEEEASVNEAYSLQLKTPVVLPQFDLRYETREGNFKAIIFDPYPENLSYFREWLKTNGFESIKSEQFIIIRGSNK